MKNFLSTLLCFCLATNMFSQTFSNTTVAAYDTWNSVNAYTGFTRTIVVSGLPNPLSAAGTVLKQVNLKLGTNTNKGNLSTFYARLVSPTGTIIQLFGPFTNTITDQWIDIKLRDHSSLERIKDYASTVTQNYWPFNIGYYKTDVSDAFSAVNGENPNGNWTLQIAENTSTEVSFEKVELIFGAPTILTDVTGSSTNDACSGAICISTSSGVVVGNNNGYAASDANYPGNLVSGCDWNANNNNSAWFYYTAAATSAYITVSGMSGGGSANMQLVVLDKNNDCAGAPSVPNGGCADDESKNNGSYLTTNGGGVGTAGQVYFNGITANCEFNLTGLTVGKSYFLYIDGNSGANSPFYIEIASGATASCTYLLPVTLLNFSGEKQQNNNKLFWKTETEINNDYFELERSYDAINFEKIAEINGAGNSNNTLSYDELDFGYNRSKLISYYRLKQVDFDGKNSYSNIVALENDTKLNDILIYPNPATNFLNITNVNDELTVYQIYSVEGKLITTGEFISTQKIDLNEYPSGTYLITTISKDKVYQQKFLKQ